MTTPMPTRAATAPALATVLEAVEQYRDAGEQDRQLHPTIVQTMREAGLFRVWTPVEYGGDELDLGQFLSIIHEVSRIDGAAGWTLANLSAGSLLVAFLPEAGAREVCAAGPDVPVPGSIAPNGRALPVDGGYRLSGHWPLASGCHYGDWLAANALVSDGEAPRMGPDGLPDLKLVFVRSRDCRLLDTWDSLGLRGSGSADFVIDDVFVPDHLTFPFFAAEPQVQGNLYSAGIPSLFSLALTSVLLGIARAAIDEFVTLAALKTPTMSQTPLSCRATIHAEVAKAEALLQSARSFIEAVAAEMTVTPADHDQETVEVRRRLACTNAGAACRQVVDVMFTLAGATPVYRGHRLERCLRDVRTAGQHMFFSHAWWEKTGQYYFGEGLGMP